MKTAIERAMQAMISAGAATDEDGDVNSPTGYFAIVEIDGTERDLFIESDDVFSALETMDHGFYVVREDDMGFTDVEGPVSEEMAHAVYARLQDEYTEWWNATEDEV